MTPAELQQAIEANTQAIAGLNQAVSFLVSEAIRPAVQQSSANYERLERLESVVEAQQQLLDSNTQAIASLIQLAEGNQQRLDAFDSRLEETRALVAENGSQIAQMRQQQVNSQQQNAQVIAELIDENRAFRESQQSQLAAIIGNGRRIDRLEQQAS